MDGIEQASVGNIQASGIPVASAGREVERFDYNSLRAQEARLGKILKNGAMQFLLILLILVCVVGFLYMIFARHNSLGWLLMGLGITLLMLRTWAVKEVIPVPVGKTENVNDLLSANVLRVMDKNPTPQTLATKLVNTRSGRFLALRFGLTPDLLTQVTAGMSADLAPILVTAKEIWRATDGETISGGMITVAILQNHPQCEIILKQMKLDLKDLYDGISWYNHLHGLVKQGRQRRRDGGIARDFNFGYIPTLQRFGRNLSDHAKGAMRTQVNLATHKEIVEKMITVFSSNGRQNVALIGAEGSGRSTIVKAFADAIMDADAKIAAGLKYRQVFMLDASALISAARGPGQLEGLITRILNEAFAAKNIIICLDNAQLFFEEGTGSVDISNLLMPILEAGRLRIILTMNEQKFLEISARNSALTNTLNKIMVPVAGREETIRVMQDQTPILEAKYKVICTFWALQEAYRLSEKYVHDIEMPGRALNLLESACNYPMQKYILAESVQQAVEKTQGVKVQTASSEADREKLLNLEELIHQRMVNQKEAVKVVSDALRRAAAGVRNENRPIGTFLFLGPTGVGKTELAKALAEVYFSGESNIVRIDLNEYVTAEDVSRLIAEGAENAESLTAQVMKHPFSVILLDEIEKAHPQVLTTLLQMLDEGVLRDTKNREISFRDTIVIATSNAGAEKIREYVAGGMDLNKLKDELIDALIHEGHFKPEFLNRFDEICVFKPLSKEDLIKVVDLMIGSVNKTLATQKITVTLTDGAKALLVERGYDPQMGARPMRRMVQKSVENLVAKLVLSGQVGSGATVNITEEMLEG